MSPAAPVLDEKVRRRKRSVGIIAVAFLLLFTVLAILNLISFLEWIIADVVVALIANLLLRRMGKVDLT
jgi:hypothetical protein